MRPDQFVLFSGGCNIGLYNMLEDKDPEELREIADNQGLDVEDAEKVKELMDEKGLDEDEATELVDLV